MASRDLVVRIDGDPSGFTKAAKSAEASAKVFERELKKSEDRQTASVAHVARMRIKADQDAARVEQASMRKRAEATEALGRGMVAAGAVIAGGIGVAVKRFADFDSAMSRVQAATHATAGTMSDLRDAALEAGKRTAFSATEAAEGIEQLSKAGVSAKEILGGALDGALDLAAAGTLAVGDAAEIAATAMTQFGLSGAEIPHVADLLAAAAGKAQGEVSDMGLALTYVGPIAAQMGVSLEETAGSIALLASNGILGEKAGTGLRGVLAALTGPSAKSAKEMEALGLSVYDATGNFVGFDGVAQQLQNSLGGLTPAQRDASLATIFGNEQLVAARILYKGGADAVDAWTGKVDDAGYAQETAAIKLDNLKGDVEALGGAFETALIGSGSGANDVLRAITQTATDGLNAFSALPTPVQQGATAVGALAAAGSLVGGAFLLAVPRVAAFNEGLATMGPRTQALGRGVGNVASALAGPWGIALGAGITALGLFAHAKAEAKAEVDTFAAAIEADSGALGKNARQTAIAALEKDGLGEAAERIGLRMSTVTDAVLGDAAAMDEVRLATSRAVAAGVGMEGQLTEQAAGADHLAERVLGLAESTDKGMAAARRNAEAMGDEGAAADAAAPAVGAVGDAMADAAEQAEKLTDAQEALASALKGFFTPLSTYEGLVKGVATATAEATSDSKDSWEDYADSAEVSLTRVAEELEADIKAQQDWETNLVKVAQRAGSGVARILADMGEEGVRLTAEMATGTDAEVQRMARALETGAAQAGEGAAVALDQKLAVMAAVGRRGAKATADGIAQELGLSVEEVARIAAQYGVKLASGINPLLAAMGKTQVNIARASATDGRTRTGYAVGGPVWGAGTATSDSIPALLSNGEYVIKASSVARYGQDFLDDVNAGAYAVGGMVRRFAAGGFASVGAVPKPPSSAPAGPPISTAADATMSTAYQAAVQAVQTLAPKLLEVTGGASAKGLNPQFLAMFNAYNQALGNILRIGSGWRSSAQQAVLYQRWINRVPGQAPAAPPGRSNHERGLAIDHTPHSTARMRAVAGAHGLRYPMSYEPWHVEPANIRRVTHRAGGVVRRAVGGPIGRAPVVNNSLTRKAEDGSTVPAWFYGLGKAAARMTDPAAVRALIAAYDDHNEALERAARRTELLRDVQGAQYELVMAMRKGTKENAAAQTALTNAERKQSQAKTADARANAAAAVAQARARVQRTQTEELTQARTKLADVSKTLLEFDRETSRERDRAAAERRIDQLEREAEAAQALAEKRKDMLSGLNDLLDEERDIRARGAEAEQDYADKVTRIQEQSAKAADELRRQQQRLLDDRRNQLSTWAALDERAAMQWGNSVEQLIANAREQAGQFEEWSSSLAAARARGVSEQVIASLGLDEGPQALGQLRQFGQATAAEIDALNAEVARRTEIAGAQTAREQQAGYGDLGRALVEAHDTYTQAMADLNDELVDAQAELLVQQAEVTTQLAALGQSQARSYGEALAAGLTSQIPAVLAAAQALQAAASGATSNASMVGGRYLDSVTGRLAYYGPAGQPGSATKTAQYSASHRMPDGRTAFYDPNLRTATYDSGGPLYPGFTLAYNGTGRTEHVVTAGQGTGGGVTINVNAPVFGVDQLHQTIRGGVESALAEKRDAALAHGVR